MFRSIAKLALLLSLVPSVSSAAPLNLFVVSDADIQVTPVSVDYDATSNIFSVGMTLLGPVSGPNLVTLSDGVLRAAQDLALSIDVRIDDVGGTPVALAGGSGLSLTGTVFNDNTVGSSILYSGTLLEGSLFDVGFDQTTIELGWNLTSGTALSEYTNPGDFGITFITGAGFFDPTIGFSEDFSSGGLFSVQTDILPAAIPVPAGFPLLLTALGSIAVARRFTSRRKQA